jgi:hypothetical protein
MAPGSLTSPMQMSNSTVMSNLLADKELSLYTSQIKKVFGDKFVSDLSSKCGSQSITCLDVEYESPNTTIIRGDYIILNMTLGDNFPNQFIWKDVDNLKTKGFVIDSVVLSGVGSKETLMSIIMIMSKK